MVDKLKVINFLQDFGCAKLEHLQTIFNSRNDNFNNILTSNIVSKKDNIFIYNNSKIDTKMLVALDILCKYKGRYVKFYINYEPICITFLSNANNLYHIIVADETNEKGIIKQVNNPACLPDADRYILAFKDESRLHDIKTNHSFLYCIYPSLEIIKQVL